MSGSERDARTGDRRGGDAGDPGASPHVLLLPSTYSSPVSPLAGLFVWNQAQALLQAGVRVGVVYPDRRSLRSLTLAGLAEQHGQVRATVEAGIRTVRWDGWNIPRRDLSGALFRAMTLKLVTRYLRMYGRPDLIHAHGAIWAGAAAAVAADRFGIPAVVTEHASAFLLGRVQGRESSWARRAYARCDPVIAVSRALAQRIEPLVSDPARLRVIGNVVETDRFTLPARPRTFDEPLRLLCLAQLQPAKGVDVLLRSFALALARRDAMVLEIGGGNRGWEPLRTLASELGIAERVRFLGPLTRDEVRSALWGAHALVVPSHVETFGVVVAEALATGLPVIATRSGGPEDIITEDLGHLVPVADEGALADALVGFDPSVELDRERAERRRGSIVSRFSAGVVAGQLVDVYREVLDARA